MPATSGPQALEVLTRLTLRDDERTLTDAELDEAVARVVSGLTDDLGARFRT